MACNAGPDIIEDGLVLCLDAANINSYPKSGTTWSDLIGSNDGALINTPTYDSDNSGAISFDGSNQYAIFDSPWGLNGGTLFFWAKRNSSSGSSALTGSYGGSGSQRSPSCYSNSSNIGWEFANLAGRTTSVPFTLGKWFNFALTYNSSFSVKVYVDSVQTNSESASSPGGFWQYEVVGRYGNYGSQYSSCSFSSYCAYNRALTADEVRQNYEATVGRFT